MLSIFNSMLENIQATVNSTETEVIEVREKREATEAATASAAAAEREGRGMQAA